MTAEPPNARAADTRRQTSVMRGLLLDLDDTLYDYQPNEQRARIAALTQVARDTGIALAEVERLYQEARQRVKARVGERGCGHSRLLYFHELAHTCGAPGALSRVRAWERAFWREYLALSELRAGARELLSGWRALGHKTAIVTDLVLEVQLWKLESFRLLDLVDAVVVSEEVAYDKPATEAFELAIARLGVARQHCVVVGDSDRKDGGGARALGVPFLRVRGSEPGEEGGMTLIEIGRELGALR